jgi:glycosyltransferase involved in cell wall biosynthesis
MRCLFLVHNLPERGSYFRALAIAQRVAARGHYVEFICTSADKMYRPRFHSPPYDKSEQALESREPVIIESPWKTVVNDKQEGWSLFDLSFRLSRVVGHQWDLVYGFSHKPDNLLPGLVARFAKHAKLVLDWADWWGTAEGLYRASVIPSEHFEALPRPIRFARRATFALDSWLEPKAYAMADAVTLISEEYFQYPRAPRNLREKSLVLHSGAPLDAIVPQDKNSARERCGLKLPPGSIVLGYVANFHTGERLLLESFARVCEHRRDVWLLVVGSDFEHSTPSVHDRIKDRVIHVGRKPFAEISAYLGAADILLLPLNDVALDRARYPHKLSDYVAAGRPVIAADVGETGRLLRRYDFGLTVSPTVEGFSDGILQCIQDNESWTGQGARTREIAEKYFNWDHLCDQLYSFVAQRTGVQL